MSVEEWSAGAPWLYCRKIRTDVSGKGISRYEEGEGEDVVGAGCACFRCWPKHIWTDTEASYLSVLGEGRRRLTFVVSPLVEVLLVGEDDRA